MSTKLKIENILRICNENKLYMYHVQSRINTKSIDWLLRQLSKWTQIIWINERFHPMSAKKSNEHSNKENRMKKEKKYVFWASFF